MNSPGRLLTRSLLLRPRIPLLLIPPSSLARFAPSLSLDTPDSPFINFLRFALLLHPSAPLPSDSNRAIIVVVEISSTGRVRLPPSPSLPAHILPFAGLHVLTMTLLDTTDSSYRPSQVSFSDCV